MLVNRAAERLLGDAKVNLIGSSLPKRRRLFFFSFFSFFFTRFSFFLLFLLPGPGHSIDPMTPKLLAGTSLVATRMRRSMPWRRRQNRIALVFIL